MVDPTPDGRLVEVVERKGIGHPDTICDALAEEVSRALSRTYLERFGRVLHHNVDKALLCGGSAAPRFGGGEITRPIEIILAGRVTRSFRGTDVPVEEVAIETCRAWLRAHLHALDPDRHLRIACRFGPGSGDLVDLFARGATPLANDTSIGVGFAPRSHLEQAVLDLGKWLDDPASQQSWPERGEDVKIMAVRTASAVTLTVTCALVSAFVKDAADYLAKKALLASAIGARASGLLGEEPRVEINAADDPARGSFYLTVTGTSAEAGDDGQVGRGNRVSGLITPGRPMTLEAAAGKNPVSHVGKLYSVAAGLIAEDLVGALPGVSAAECTLVSRIGSPIDEPQAVSVRLRIEDGPPAAAHSSAVAEVTRGWLAGLPGLSARLIAGDIAVF